MLTMPSFGPSKQRTVIAVLTASALGSGCQAWLSRGGNIKFSSASAVIARGSSDVSKASRVPLATAAAVALAAAVTASATGFFSTLRLSGVYCSPPGSAADSSFEGMGSSDNGSSKSLRPLVVCGPSGVGKGTLINMLLKDFPGRFGFSVSHTTRKPRPGEVDGTHYHFVTDKDHILKMIEEGKFIEHAHVHGNVYGTSIAAVQDVSGDGKICVLDIDVQGVKSVKQAPPSVLDPHYLFISPPSIEILEDRLRGRGTETEEALKRRLANSKEEMEYGTSPGAFEKILVNDGLQEAYEELKATAKEWYPQLEEDTGKQAKEPAET